MIDAVIIAGGKGERLKPLTDTIPKPLIKVGKLSLIEINLRLLQKYGLKNIFVTTGYLSEKIENYLKKRKGSGQKIKVYSEKSPLGSAGLLREFIKELSDPFLVCYADIIREINIREVLAFHKRKKALATIVVYQNPKSNPKSLIEFNKKNTIISFIERPNSEKLPNTVWSNGSLFIFQKKIQKYLSKKKVIDFGGDILPELVKSKKVFAFVQKGYFLDVGNLEKLKKARADLKKGIICC